MSTAPALARERPDWDDLRAFLALLLGTTAGCIAVLYAPYYLSPELGYILFGLGPDDDPTPAIMFLLSVELILIGLVGAAACRYRIVAGNRRDRATLAALPLGIGAVTVLVLSAVVIGAAHQEPTPPFRSGLDMALVGTLLFVLQASGEEVLLRGFMQPVMTRAWGAGIALLLATASFTLLHSVGGWDRPLSLINIALGGLWFGLLAWRTGGILAPTLAHFGYNWSEEMIFGASPNPGTGSYGSAIDFDLSGAAIWGGSPDGFNAGIALTIVLLALILPLALRFPFRDMWKNEAAA